MDFHNSREALNEVLYKDMKEGADIIMIKPVSVFRYCSKSSSEIDLPSQFIT